MSSRAPLNVTQPRSPSGELTLDQLLAEPIVQQLMRRDKIDATTVRHLLQATASARRASSDQDDLNAEILWPAR